MPHLQVQFRRPQRYSATIAEGDGARDVNSPGSVHALRLELRLLDIASSAQGLSQQPEGRGHTARPSRAPMTGPGRREPARGGYSNVSEPRKRLSQGGVMVVGAPARGREKGDEVRFGPAALDQVFELGGQATRVRCGRLPVGLIMKPVERLII